MEWLDFDNSGSGYLVLNGCTVAQIEDCAGKFVVYPVAYGHVFSITEKSYTDMETAKKSVEDLIRNFCVDFNIWYMR